MNQFKIFLVSLIPTGALVGAVLMNSQYLSTLGESAEQILSKNYKSIRAAQDARKIIETGQRIWQSARFTSVLALTADMVALIDDLVAINEIAHLQQKLQIMLSLGTKVR